MASYHHHVILSEHINIYIFHHCIAAPLELSQHKLLHWAVSEAASSKRTDDYKHIKILGSGAFGTTHLVRNLVDQESPLSIVL